MKEKKIPLRSCVVTKEKLPKQQLIRIIRTPEGLVEIDYKGKSNGRGAYLKNDIEVIQKAKKTKILNRHLQTEVNDEIFEELLNNLK
ncbi:MAG: YlxR family protein [Mycoplasmatota bacterium]